MKMNASRLNEKRKALLAYKDKLLNDLKYYKKRIEEARSFNISDTYFYDDESSDSDSGLGAAIDTGLTLRQLKLEQSTLKTCLLATQELTSLQVQQSEVNLLTSDPVFENEPPVNEPGTWREVMVESRVDSIPISVTFFVHKPYRKLGQPSYRGLHVTPTKKAHELELAKSVLPGLTRPSDAVDVIKNYAVAYRSRRATLTKLADKYGDMMSMEPLPDGGYLIKCADLLEMSWVLENKWSPIAHFFHRMKFDIEYMDESYIKIITQLHRQLSDPSVETDERTMLLSKIIMTCLEARGPTQELYESMESDSDAAQNIKKRRTTLDEIPEAPLMKKRRADDEEKQMMAPPKSLPKKVKPKGKENFSANNNSGKNINKINRTSNLGDLNKEKNVDTDKNKTKGNVNKDNGAKETKTVSSKVSKQTSKDRYKISEDRKSIFEAHKVRANKDEKEVKKTNNDEEKSKSIDKVAKENDKNVGDKNNLEATKAAKNKTDLHKDQNKNNLNPGGKKDSKNEGINSVSSNVNENKTNPKQDQIKAKITEKKVEETENRRPTTTNKAPNVIKKSKVKNNLNSKPKIVDNKQDTNKANSKQNFNNKKTEDKQIKSNAKKPTAVSNKVQTENIQIEKSNADKTAKVLTSIGQTSKNNSRNSNNSEGSSQSKIPKAVRTTTTVVAKKNKMNSPKVKAHGKPISKIQKPVVNSKKVLSNIAVAKSVLFKGKLIK